MFETDIKEDFKLNLLLVKKYTILHTCRICKKKINTYWKKDDLLGEFFADDISWSDVLDIAVSWPHEIKCFKCYFRY